MSQQTEPLSNGLAEVDRVFRSLVFEASNSYEGVTPAAELLTKHLGFDPTTGFVATLSKHFVFPVLQTGIDHFLAGPARTHEVLGMDCPIGDPNHVLTLNDLLTPPNLRWPGATLGSATWERLQVGHEKHLRCLERGMILLHDNGRPAAIWVTTNKGGIPTRYITVLTAERAHTDAILDEIEHLGIEHTPYAGAMFVAAANPTVFMPRPERLGPDDLVLPPELLARIDQHAIGIALGSKRLAAAGQHLKRGLLLYGPPGTGKTHTMRYLASRLPEDTTILVAEGLRLWRLEQILAYTGPSTMIMLDDIDAVASNRSLAGVRHSLFQLLEMLDGLHGQGNVAFVLTTNRLNVLEPAVAARPGRIDEALEVPRPDAECRRRLFACYRRGMDLQISEEEIDQVVQRTEGVTGSFTKELLRRATIVAVERDAEPDDDGRVTVTGADVFGALDEMLDPANPATRLLLGAPPDHAIPAVSIVGGGER